MGFQLKIKAEGVQEGIELATRIQNFVNSCRAVELDYSERTVEILIRQHEMDRKVTQFSESEQAHAGEIATEHLERCRDAKGRLVAGTAAGLRMYRALGEWGRATIAGKIEGSVASVKRPLTPRYAKWKQDQVEKGYALTMTRPWAYRLASRALRALPEQALDNTVLPVLRAWTEGRAGLKPSPKSFRQLWDEGI